MFNSGWSNVELLSIKGSRVQVHRFRLKASEFNVGVENIMHGFVKLQQQPPVIVHI